MSVSWSNHRGQPLTQTSYSAWPTVSYNRKPNYTQYPGTGLQPGAQWQGQQYQYGLNNMTARMGALSFGSRRKRKTRRGGGGVLGKLAVAAAATGTNARYLRGTKPAPKNVKPFVLGSIGSPMPLPVQFAVLPNGTAKNVTKSRKSRRRKN